MKKNNKKIFIGILIAIAIAIISAILMIIDFKKTEDDEIVSYSNVVVDGYQIKVNDNYKFEYDKEKKEGYFKSDIFSYSYLFVSEEPYGELITSSSYYTNMGAKELDTSIEEMKFGEYEGFINEKKVYYEDVEKEYHLVLIFIKISDKKTFVVQYEVTYEEEYEEILDDIKEGLTKIKKIN